MLDKPFFRTVNLNKSYSDDNTGQVVKACVDINIDIEAGHFFYLLGPSGCGKSTLLNLISGLIVPDSGTIILEGQDITNYSPQSRPINTIFQNYALFPHLDVFENIAFGLRIKKLPQAIIKVKVEEYLNLIGMSQLQNRHPDQLSGGQQQRVAIARAMINQPKILLLDEPFSALDTNTKDQMKSELKNLQKKLGSTFICVTHDQEEALELADQLAVMNHGRIEQVGTPYELCHQPQTEFIAQFIKHVKSNFFKPT